MSVKTYALTTLTRFKQFAGITSNSTQDAVIERLIDSVTEFVENYIGYRVQQATYTNENYDTDDSDTLILNKFPVSSVSSLQRRNSALNEDSWETIDSQYYHLDSAAGIIYGAGGWKFSRTRRGYRVTYVAGFNFDNASTFLSDTEGGDLEFVCWQLVATAWNMRKGGTGIEQESIGDYSVTYKKEVMQNDDIKAILDKYARNDTVGVQSPYVY